MNLEEFNNQHVILGSLYTATKSILDPKTFWLDKETSFLDSELAHGQLATHKNASGEWESVVYDDVTGTRIVIG